MTRNLIAASDLAKRLGSENLVIVDASWHLPAAKRNAREEFGQNHIPGAVFYSLDEGAAADTDLPHMLPTSEKFATDMGALGVTPGALVVIYDASGLFSAARLWWMLKSFGQKQVMVLDGGLPKWKREGLPLSSQATATAGQSALPGTFNPNLWKNMADVSAALNSGKAKIIDARSQTRFRGEEAEPRAGVRPGHMIGAANVHYATLFNPDGTMKQGQALKDVFDAAAIDLNAPIITSCGSGVTAAILNLALTELGLNDHALYDGSWAQWGASQNPIATG